jgi:hypothetical protein
MVIFRSSAILAVISVFVIRELSLAGILHDAHRINVHSFISSFLFDFFFFFLENSFPYIFFYKIHTNIISFSLFQVAMRDTRCPQRTQEKRNQKSFVRDWCWTRSAHDPFAACQLRELVPGYLFLSCQNQFRLIMLSVGMKWNS